MLELACAPVASLLLQGRHHSRNERTLSDSVAASAVPVVRGFGAMAKSLLRLWPKSARAVSVLNVADLSSHLLWESTSISICLRESGVVQQMFACSDFVFDCAFNCSETNGRFVRVHLLLAGGRVSARLASLRTLRLRSLPAARHGVASSMSSTHRWFNII
jgi:hypothetical protein